MTKAEEGPAMMRIAMTTIVCAVFLGCVTQATPTVATAPESTGRVDVPGGRTSRNSMAQLKALLNENGAGQLVLFFNEAIEADARKLGSFLALASEDDLKQFAQFLNGATDNDVRQFQRRLRGVAN